MNNFTFEESATSASDMVFNNEHLDTTVKELSEALNHVISVKDDIFRYFIELNKIAFYRGGEYVARGKCPRDLKWLDNDYVKCANCDGDMEPCWKKWFEGRSR